MTVPFAYSGPVDPQIVMNVKRMQTNAVGRDRAIDRIRSIRAGRFEEVWPDIFSEQIPHAIVANFVDVAARDLASNLSPLPSLACSAGNMKTDADRSRAAKKNKIGSHYWRWSKLETQMKWAADQYLSYGFLPAWVEADYAKQMPVIHLEDPNGSYYELNRWMECERYARVWRQDINEVAALFPEYAHRILNDPLGRAYDSSSTTEVVRYIDGTRCMIYLPERNDMVVNEYSHGMDKCPVHIAVRPGLEREPRGQYDDVLFVQLAQTMLASLTLEAGFKAVQAPIAVPDDVSDLPVGPDAIIVTARPQDVQRVHLEVPSAAFALGQQLGQEMHEGAGYPDTRLGNGPAGGSTGRGISALEGGFNAQIKNGQDVLGLMLRIVTEFCFDMEFRLWPRKEQTINGVLSGESFRLRYSPAVDLADQVSVEITYGFASGLSANAMIVTMLQLRGDSIIGRETFRENLPFDIDGEKEKRDLHVQALEDAALQGMQASLTELGPLIAAGNVAGVMMLLQASASVIKGRREGKDLADLMITAFQPPPAPPGAPGESETPGGLGEPAPGAPGDLSGVGPDGLPVGTAPGQAGMAPGGRPSVQDLTAGFTQGGAPNVQANVRRRIAIG